MAAAIETSFFNPSKTSKETFEATARSNVKERKSVAPKRGLLYEMLPT
jgi:hypothetical protein